MSRTASGASDRPGAAVNGDEGRGCRRASGDVGEVVAEGVEDLAGDVALEAADDLVLGLAFGGAAFGVGLGLEAVAQAADGDHVQGAVGVAVAAVVQPVAVGAPRVSGDRAGATKRGERAVAAEPLDVLSGGDEQLARVSGRSGTQTGRARRGRGDQGLERVVELGDLLVELGDASAYRAQGEPGGLVGLV